MSNLAEAHAAMAAIKFEEWDWVATEREFRRALELNPHSVDACGCYPGILAAWGRPDDATAVLDRVLKANPLSSTIHWTYSLVEYTARDYAESIRHAERAAELSPEAGWVRTFQAFSLIALGRLEEALAVADQPGVRGTAVHGYAYALLGRRDEALAVARGLMDRGVDLQGVALIYYALGDKTRGFEWQTRAFDLRQSQVVWANVMPFFDNLRDEPRFQALIARMKLPAAPARIP